MTIRRSGPNVVDVNNERLTFEDEMTASDFIACLSHGDVESCSAEFPPEQTEYIGDEIGNLHGNLQGGADANLRAGSIKDGRSGPAKKTASKKTTPKPPTTKSNDS